MHIQRLVPVEKRPFCYRDFLDFEVDGKTYSMTHGTFRNKISKLVMTGYAQLEYYSGPAFYSLKGVNFAKPKHGMTDNHAVVSLVSSMLSVSFINRLPTDKHALHDIRCLAT
jgi:hypothetical protein